MSTLSVSDTVDRDSGKTYRQINSERTHAIPINTLVEVDCSETYDSATEHEKADPDWYGHSHGLRLYVVQHTRDCDQTPLYSLSFHRAEEVQKKIDFNKKCVVETEGGTRVRGELGMSADILTGFSEESLKLIR